MSIFYLDTSTHILNVSTDYNNSHISLITPFYNWVTSFGYTWIYSTLICDVKRYTQICISDKGSVCCVYVDNVDNDGIYYPFGLKNYLDFNNDVNKAAEFYFKRNQYLLISKYEKIFNVYILFSDKIIRIIDYLPNNISQDYIRNIYNILEEYLDVHNKLRSTTEIYYNHRATLSQSQCNLIKLIKQKDEEKKTLSKIIKDTGDIINSNFI